MIATIEKGTATGRIYAPPSKSMAHRYLICAALSKGQSKISRIKPSEDIKATLSCLKELGAEYSIEGDTVTIGGIDFNTLKGNRLFCNESGSTLRFLIPMCLMFGSEITLYGTERLMQRSLTVYEEICRNQGMLFKQGKESVTVNGKLQSGKYQIRGDISSQFISGLLFVLPLLEGDSIIDITGVPESVSYITLTLKALADFGVRISRTDANTVYIKGGQTYKPRNLTVEGDYSNAAFFEAFNLIGGNVKVEGLNEESFQGDRVYRTLFSELEKGCPTIDISDCPDLGPVLLAAAACKNGAVFTGTHRLKIKESDRGEAMAEELKKFGVTAVVRDNSIEIKEAKLISPAEALNGHNDHRIVMSLAVLCTLTGGKITGAEAVKKSMPDFFDKLTSLGIKVNYNEA